MSSRRLNNPFSIAYLNCLPAACPNSVFESCLSWAKVKRCSYFLYKGLNGFVLNAEWKSKIFLNSGGSPAFFDLGTLLPSIG